MFNSHYYRQCPAEHYPYTVQPGDTLNIIAFRLESSVTRILAANPGVDPNSLRVGQRLCIPQIGGAPDVTGLRETITAMQSDINMLKADSSVQQKHESNYGNSTQTTRVSPREIRFEIVPVTFAGAYRGHFTASRRYPYYVDASMGGRRTINVKDNFGVWHSFNYKEQTPRS